MPCDWTKAGYTDFDDCKAKNADKGDPAAYCASIRAQLMGELRHPHFKKIYQDFQTTYAHGDKNLEPFAAWQYYQFVDDYSLDETHAYEKFFESFQWAKDMLTALREDENNKFYKVTVAFPYDSMNGNPYSEPELEAAAKSIIGVPMNINHNRRLMLPETVKYIDANYEEGAVEAILQVPKDVVCTVCAKGVKLYQMLDQRGIVNVSLEADRDGAFKFTGCALLTLDTLPGFATARIFPSEKFISEALQYKRNEFEVRFKIKVPQKVEVKTDSKPAISNADRHSGLEISDAKLRAIKAESALKASELRIAELEKINVETETENNKLRGANDTLNQAITKLETRIKIRDEEKVDDSKRITAFQRRIEDLGTENAELKTEHEAIGKNSTDTFKKYQDTLSANIALTRTNTELLEKLSALEKDNAGIKEKLAKAKRLGKIVAKIS